MLPSLYVRLYRDCQRWRLLQLICEQKKSALQSLSALKGKRKQQKSELPPAFLHVSTLFFLFLFPYFNILSFSAYSVQRTQHAHTQTLPVPPIRQMTGEDSQRCQTRLKSIYWLLLWLHSVPSFHLKNSIGGRSGALAAQCYPPR